jgi:segregation and condensation protein A
MSDIPAGIAVSPEEALVVDVDGFEGPLDLLLELARRQKVDLARISILALADQYLAFVEAVRQTRLEVAADYLVVAAWLAYLKSRLLLPDPATDGDEPPASVLAAALAFRLKRLEAMRQAGEKLMSGDLLGRERFARGAPERLAIIRRSRYEASLYELLSAYADMRGRSALSSVTVRRRPVWSLAEARATLERILGHAVHWGSLESFLEAFAPTDAAGRASVLAVGFGASLELVRAGRLELRQDRPFAPLMMRARRVVPTGEAEESDAG